MLESERSDKSAVHSSRDSRDEARSSRTRLSFHEGLLRLHGVANRVIEKLFDAADVTWTHDDRQDCFVTDAAHYRRVRERLSSGLVPSTVDWVFPRGTSNNEARHRIALPADQGPELRGDQLAAVEAWLNNGHTGVIEMPTGTGKTVVAIELIKRCATSTLIVVPIRDLMYQWHARILETTGVDAGLIGDGVHRVAPICVTTYDSAAIHMPRIGNRFELVVFDEVHHLAGAWRSDAALMSAAPWRLGLTATLPTEAERAGRIEMLVGKIVYRDTIDAARGRTLASYRITRIPVRLIESERRRYRELAGIVQQFVAERRSDDPSFRWDQIFSLATEDLQARRCLKAYRLKTKVEERASGKLRVLEDLFRLHRGEPILVFVGSNVMARDISLRFLVPCLLSHCAKRERRELLTGLAAGTYPVLVANRVLDEGVDLPEVKVAIVLGGTSSSRQAIQRLGRVLRKGSRRDAVLYEIVTDETSEVARSRKRRRNDAYRT